MKTYSLVLTCLCAAMLANSASAMSGTSLQQSSLLSGESVTPKEALYDGGPRFLSVGAYLADQKRGLDGDGMGSTEWNIRHTLAYLGIDLTPWLTVLGGAGQSSVTTYGQSGDSDFEWLGAIQLRLLDHLALDSMLNNGAYTVSVNSEFRAIGSKTEVMGSDIKWLELFGSLTMNIAVNLEHDGGILDRLSVFFGPAYSAITASDDSGFSADMNESEAIGFIGGIEMNPSENIALRLEYQKFDAGTFGGSLTFHF